MPTTPAAAADKKDKEREVAIAPYAAAVKAGKALLTRRINQAADKLRSFHSAPPSQGALQEMAEVKRTIREAVSRVEDAYTKISTVDDPKNFEEYMKKLEAEVARADPVIDDITDKIIRKEMELGQLQRQASPTHSVDGGDGDGATANVPPVRTTSNASAGGPSRKPNDALKPFTLMADHSPVEMDEWIERFRAYHSTSRMDLCSAVDQQAYLRSCLDPALYNRIKDKMDDNMPVFVPIGSPQEHCMRLIRQEFREHFPLITRRVAFFRQDQKPGEPFSDWARAVQESAAQCQFENIKQDDLVILRLLTGVADKKLAIDLYKLPKTNLQTIRETAIAHEVANRTMAAVNVPKDKAAAFQANAKTGNKSKGKSGGSASANSAQTKGSGQTNFKCYRCGDNNKTHNCKATSATCKYCSKTGHFASVCNKKKADGKGNSSSNTNKQKQKGKSSGAAQQAVTGDSDDDNDSSANANAVAAE